MGVPVCHYQWLDATLHVPHANSHSRVWTDCEAEFVRMKKFRVENSQNSQNSFEVIMYYCAAVDASYNFRWKKLWNKDHRTESYEKRGRNEIAAAVNMTFRAMSHNFRQIEDGWNQFSVRSINTPTSWSLIVSHGRRWRVSIFYLLRTLYS